MPFLKRKIYHYHIPRTGGTSVNFAFLSLIGNAQEMYDKINKHLFINGNNLCIVRDDRKRILHGEYDYAFSHSSAWKTYPGGNPFRFTMIREPIARLLSFYNGLLQRKREGQYRPGIDWLGNSFVEFLNTIPHTALKAQLYMFSKNFKAKEALELLKQRVDGVFCYEQRDKITNMLSNVAGIRLSVFYANKTDYVYEPTATELNKLKELLRDETTFYERAKEHVV